MKRFTIGHLIALLGVGVTLITALVAVFATYDIAGKGANPPKRLMANYFTVTDPLSDLAPETSGLSIAVRRGDTPIENLRVVQTILTNTGEAPILPSDFVEALKLTARPPWRIVNVVNSTAFTGENGVQPRWTRVNDSEFRAAPVLLNPGDKLGVSIYLTGEDEVDSVLQSGENYVRWSARVVNLPSIGTAPNAFEELVDRIGPVFIILWIWPILFIIATFSIYFYMTAVLMDKIELIYSRGTSSYLWLLGGALINICAAEAGSTYVFGSNPAYPMPINHQINLPFIVINASMIAILYVISRRRNGVSADSDD